MLKLLRGFEPGGLYGSNEEPIGLILGSFPSQASLSAGEYYANPRNHFWPLIGEYRGEDLKGASYKEKLMALANLGLLVWDVFETCEREGSLDSSIRKETPNKIRELLESRPGIVKIALNGTAAAHEFAKRFLNGRNLLPRAGTSVDWRPDFDDSRTIRLFRLPSTSPVPTRKFRTLGDKSTLWLEFLEFGERG